MLNGAMLESALYWFVYGFGALTIAIVVGAMSFGAIMTLRWFLKGGKTKPGAHG